VARVGDAGSDRRAGERVARVGDTGGDRRTGRSMLIAEPVEAEDILRRWRAATASFAIEALALVVLRSDRPIASARSSGSAEKTFKISGTWRFCGCASAETVL
jgi:superfamily II DNA/RNA helicase